MLTAADGGEAQRLLGDVPLPGVQECLGHATINVTLDTYSHVTAGMQREAAEAIAAIIIGPV